MIDPQSTHSFEVRGDVVVKRFTGKREGEHEREWRALNLLAEYAPGLAPVPIELDGVNVAMSRLDGVTLRSMAHPRPMKELALALTELYSAMPAQVLADVPLRLWHLEELRAQIAKWCAAWQSRDELSDLAVSEGARWLAGWEPSGDGVTPVFGAGDGNLANYLWDGSRVRMLDFEDSGRSDKAFELAEIVEHVAFWVDGEADLLAHIDLTPAEERRLADCRRLHALTWFFLLSPEGPRNPPGTFHRQAERLLSRLGSPAGA